MREQDYLARRGYAVLHTDYRNHAQSDDDPASELSCGSATPRTSINAVLAIKASWLSVPRPRPDRLLGRSMGGGVTSTPSWSNPGSSTRPWCSRR